MSAYAIQPSNFSSGQAVMRRARIGPALFGLWAALLFCVLPPTLRAGEVDENPDGTIVPGLNLFVYDLSPFALTKIPQLVPGQSPNLNLPISRIDLAAANYLPLTQRYLAHIDGTISITRAGGYEFRLDSTDGARLFINGQATVDNDGDGPRSRVGSITLALGPHDIQVEHFSNGTDGRVALSWKPPGDTAFSVVPAGVFTCLEGTRVVSDGPKQIVQNNPNGGQDRLDPNDLHPSFRRIPLHTKVSMGDVKVCGLDFFSDGRMAYLSYKGGSITIVSGTNGNADAMKATTINLGSTKIGSFGGSALGMKIVDDQIYVNNGSGIYRLIDTDKNGLPDDKELVCGGFG